MLQEGQRQALAGVAQGRGGEGAQLLGQTAAEPVRAPGPSVGQCGLQGGIGLEALEDKIPEGDDRIEQAVVEGGVLEGRQPPQLAAGQQIQEQGEQLLGVGAGGGAGLAGGGPGTVLFDWHVCMYDDIPTMVKKKITLSRKAFQAKVAALWPALKGSLSRVRKPCIRPHCAACASGQKHPAYMLSFTERGHRRCMYVPDALAPFIRRGLRNGRTLERLLGEMGPALLQEHRRKRPFASGKPPRAPKSSPYSKKPDAKN